MLLNYHEMTMNEPRNSPARKQQFIVICTVMVAFFAHTAITSGIFQTIDPQEGIFPGGNFIYKFANRDYAASSSLAARIRNDLQMKSEYEGDELIYHIYLDDPNRMGGRRQRWMTGILVGDDEIAQTQINKLKSKNPAIEKTPLTKDDLEELSAIDLWKRLPYEQTDLPSVDSLVLQFPFTNGFVSALTLSYKVIPAMRKLVIERNAKEGEDGDKTNVPIVISMCSVKDEMCTHYAPLLKGTEFLCGRPNTEEHLGALPPEHYLDWEGLKDGGRKVFPFAKKYIDKLP